jgi:hypothetical protein
MLEKKVNNTNVAVYFDSLCLTSSLLLGNADGLFFFPLFSLLIEFVCITIGDDSATFQLFYPIMNLCTGKLLDSSYLVSPRCG